MGMWIFILSFIGAICALIETRNNGASIGISIYIAIIIFIINIAAGNVAEIIRKTCSPDTVYYNKASQLISARIYWSVGIHIGAVLIGTYIGIGILFSCNWWQSLIVLVVAVIITLVSRVIVESMDKNSH